MNEKVARQALSIVRKTAPTEEARGVKGALGRAVQKGVPVDGLFACVGRNRVDPSATGAVAVRVGLNHENVTESSGGINFLGFRVEDGTDPLAAYLDHAICLLRRIDHGESIFYGMGHWLFAIDVFASEAGVDKQLAMLVIRRRDDDSVNILAIENFSIVA